MSDSDVAKVGELVKDIRIAMLTTTAPDRRLMSHPMATQDSEFDGVVRFIAERASQKVANLEASPQVNVAYSGSGTWVSLSGTARVVSDAAELEKYWSTFTDAWLEGGPGNPNNIIIEVEANSAEYWDGPGSKVVQLLNLVKAKATGKRYEGDNEQVDL